MCFFFFQDMETYSQNQEIEWVSRWVSIPPGNPLDGNVRSGGLPPLPPPPPGAASPKGAVKRGNVQWRVIPKERED